jgi:hypothetical protein
MSNTLVVGNSSVLQDPKTSWIKRFLGIEISGGGSDLAGLKQRLDAVISRLKAIGDRSLLNELTPLTKTTLEAVRAKDVGTVLSGISRLESRAEDAERQRQTPAVRNRINFPKLLLHWKKTEQDAVTNVETLVDMALSLPEVVQHPLYDSVVAAVPALVSLVPTFSDELQDALDAVYTADSDQKRDAALASARRAVARYRTALNGTQELAELEALANRELETVNIIAPLSDALDRIDAALAS